ncbi:MAG TPA: sigma-54 dependent transcriptional regulator [Steroidobacter sp.]|uniref:sigma-54 interaction domain-containing protein n=1 Tax=Steroidobacter sp. TaxID=1978227 RepID=UPI002EDA6F3E
MSDQPGRLLVYPESSAHPLSIRAKAAIFADPKSQALLDQLDRVAPADAPVLIVGETGTGKELVARHLHTQSRRKGAFVAVNCGALSQTLAEAELFGHQAGAFTGANETRAGWFEAANGGTLFLDEIGDLPLPLQVKLLRVLQEREVVRVGSRKAIPLDVRLVAATNIDLAAAVSAGHFRLDLYYRLNVVTFDLPPLRDRRGDIMPLAEHFLFKYSEKLRLEPPALTPATRQALLHYAWPGNIRELENVIHFALLTADGDVRPEHLRFAAAPQTATTGPTAPPIENIAAQLDQLFAAAPAELYQTLEDLIVRRAFDHCSHNQVQTARLLGISRNVLRTLLKRLGLISSDTAAEEYPDLRLVAPGQTTRAVS